MRNIKSAAKLNSPASARRRRARMAAKRDRDSKARQELQQHSSTAMDTITQFHTYACSSPGPSADDIPLPESASTTVTPEAKKGKLEPSLIELQENIVKLVSAKITESAEGIQNTIKELKEHSEFLATQIQDMRGSVEAVEATTKDHEERINALEDKVNEMERYHRRWNLRLYGLAEVEGEDVKRRIIDICRAVLPEAGDSLHFLVDICHRVGRRQENKTRVVIIRFTTRYTRDKIWKNAKTSEELTNRRLHFTEDLTTKDKETRNKLWPHVEAARNQGKKAFFVGAKAIIDGKEFKL